MTDFAMNVWDEARHLQHRAKNLWREDWEDGVSETVVRAISKQHLFAGGNLAAWLNTIMSNLRRDHFAKGYAKGTKVDAPRMVYAGGYDYAWHIPTLDSPEAILIAVEDYGGKVDKLQFHHRKHLRSARGRKLAELLGVER